MDAAVWGFIGVIVGGLLAGIVTVLAENVRANKAANLDTTKRSADREIAREAFQRDNLLELQEAFRAWMRAETRLYLADAKAWREQGHAKRLPEDINTKVFETGTRLVYLTERVTADGLRNRLVEIRTQAAPMPNTPSSPDETESRWVALTSAANRVQIAIGEELRRYL